jgi:hypothetical protein
MVYSSFHSPYCTGPELVSILLWFLITVEAICTFWKLTNKSDNIQYQLGNFLYDLLDTGTMGLHS